jgi:hypothetical protein
MREARSRLEVAMQDERVEVGAIGPYDRSELIVHPNLRKEIGVGKRLEHRTVQLSDEVDIAGTAIAEVEMQSVVAENFGRYDRYEVHDPILRQRVDRLRSTAILRPAPVRL